MGAGAMGSFLAAKLAPQHGVTIVARPPHAAAVSAVGLAVEGRTSAVARPRAVTSAKDAGTPDLLVITTKAYDTQRAIRECLHLLGPETKVLTLQNGLGNVEALREHVHPSRLLAGATAHGVTLVGPGRIRHAGEGYTVIGAVDATGADHANDVVTAWNAAGIETTSTTHIEGELWAKAIVNAGINPIAAITGLANGYLVKIPELGRLMNAACSEGIAVATALGVPLPDDDLIARTRKVAERTAANKCSMLQDIERGRRTEIDAICGEIVRKGEEVALDVPVNRALHALVRGIEATTRG